MNKTKFTSIILMVLLFISLFGVSIKVKAAPIYDYTDFATTYNGQSIIIKNTTKLQEFIVVFVNEDYVEDSKTYTFDNIYFTKTPANTNNYYYMWDELKNIFYYLANFGNNDDNYYSGYNDGYAVGNTEGYNDGYNIGVADTKIALTDIQIIIISIILFVLGLIIALIYKIKWLYAGISILCFIPMILVDNLYIKLFSVIMFLVMIMLAFFNGKENEW